MVLGGGLPRGALVIIVGPPGSGKTTLANQMAFAAARAGQRAMVEDEIASPANRAPFDLPELDTLLSGGLTRHTNTLVIGSIATGKTLLGLHFALAGVRRGEPTIFLGFRENYRQLLLKTSPFTLE